MAPHISKTNFRLLAKTFHGLEPLLADELKSLGARNIEPGKRCVYFYGDKALLYKANYSLRTALRLLKPIGNFCVYHAEDLYHKVYRLNWLDYIPLDKTIAVDSSVHSKYFPHSKFAALRVKDAIVDRLRKERGTRPYIDRLSADIKIDVHILEDHCTISLDSSGASLHKRAYRNAQHQAPLNEVLAAGLVLYSGWTGKQDFLDPMCGSGTLLIEAAMLISGTPAQFLREKFAFQNWPDYDEGLFQKIIWQEKAKIQPVNVDILGRDIDTDALKTAVKSLELLDLKEAVHLEVVNFFSEENKTHSLSLMVLNPPYNQRLPADVPVFYKAIGDTLKKNYSGTEAWIFCPQKIGLKNIGLKPSRKIDLLNGKIPCQLIKYELYRGSERR